MAETDYTPNAPVQFNRYAPMAEDRDAFLKLNPNSLPPLLVEDRAALWEMDAIALRLIELVGNDFWPDARRESERRGTAAAVGAAPGRPHVSVP